MKQADQAPQKAAARAAGTGLWTHDFTIITAGSLISMVGNTMAGFAISLVVLDYTGSTFLYLLFNAAAQLPMLVCPIFAGPYLDRVSRKKTIYTLDFCCSGLYLLIAFLLHRGWFSYPLLLFFSLLAGAVNSVYSVAYDSFYPNLIPPGSQSRAYAVSSMLWPIAAMSAPAAALLYETLGSAAAIFALNAALFFTAACFERRIRHQETHMAAAPAAGALRRFGQDLAEGLAYIRGEKGLLIITAYFTITNFSYATDQLALPFFRNNAARFAAWPAAAATLYAILSNFNTLGRFAGGLIQYKLRFAAQKKFAIALTVYITLCFLEAFVLFLPVPLMAVCYFAIGILGVTSYTIRAAATQSYVPDAKRARFNGVFLMCSSLGGVCGSLFVGALAEVFEERAVVFWVQLSMLAVIYLLMYRGRRHVAAIYNQDL